MHDLLKQLNNTKKTRVKGLLARDKNSPIHDN